MVRKHVKSPVSLSLIQVVAVMQVLTRDERYFFDENMLGSWLPCWTKNSSVYHL